MEGIENATKAKRLLFFFRFFFFYFHTHHAFQSIGDVVFVYVFFISHGSGHNPVNNNPNDEHNDGDNNNGDFSHGIWFYSHQKGKEIFQNSKNIGVYPSVVQGYSLCNDFEDCTDLAILRAKLLQGAALHNNNDNLIVM